MMYAKLLSLPQTHRSQNASDGMAETTRDCAVMVKPASSRKRLHGGRLGVNPACYAAGTASEGDKM